MFLNQKRKVIIMLGEIINLVVEDVFTDFTVMIISQYTGISSHDVLHLKLI